MGSLSIWHWIVVIVVVLLLFGRGKISELMGDMAQGIKAFKKGMSDDEKTRPKPSPTPMKTIDHNAPTRCDHGLDDDRKPQGGLTAARSDGDRVACERGGARPLTVRRPLELRRSMFDIGWSELLVIGIVALIAIGPKELPGVLRSRRPMDGQDPAHGVGLPGPVPGGDARSRGRRPEEAIRRGVERRHAISRRASTIRSRAPKEDRKRVRKEPMPLRRRARAYDADCDRAGASTPAPPVVAAETSPARRYACAEAKPRAERPARSRRGMSDRSRERRRRDRGRARRR